MDVRGVARHETAPDSELTRDAAVDAEGGNPDRVTHRRAWETVRGQFRFAALAQSGHFEPPGGSRLRALRVGSAVTRSFPIRSTPVSPWTDAAKWPRLVLRGTRAPCLAGRSIAHGNKVIMNRHPESRITRHEAQPNALLGFLRRARRKWARATGPTLVTRRPRRARLAWKEGEKSLAVPARLLNISRTGARWSWRPHPPRPCPS